MFTGEFTNERNGQCCDYGGVAKEERKNRSWVCRLGASPKKKVTREERKSCRDEMKEKEKKKEKKIKNKKMPLIEYMGLDPMAHILNGPKDTSGTPASARGT
ncbi:unnamed protein product [Cuscuta epithymum]|uniref:Uncharacterized protein n=1 Tax=Cuscuta epithymum TaxID=186058 RepID=A0AAV0EXB5_9ASTE|nr:unnamed protein product [Cuscuta epithymum]